MDEQEELYNQVVEMVSQWGESLHCGVRFFEQSIISWLDNMADDLNEFANRNERIIQEVEAELKEYQEKNHNDHSK